MPRRLLLIAALLALTAPAALGLGAPPARAAVTYTIAELGALPGSEGSEARGFNAAGQVIGVVRFRTGRRAVLWQGGTITELGGLPGGDLSEANAISDQGQVAGYAVSADRKSRAVLWQGGAIADLGALPGGSAGMAHAINNSGQVAGMAYTANSQLRAALWQGGTVADLGILPGGSGWDLLDATSINDAGQIVGHGRVGGQTEVHAYLLTPVGTPVPPSAGGGGRSVQPWGTSPLVALGLLALLTLLTCRHIASRRGGSTGPGAASRGEAP